jgi:OFA family oxalate/formate antiporter-like MFS transporter
LKPVTQAKTKARSHGEDFNSLEMLQTPHFYVLYIMMLLMGIGGLLVTAQLAPVADTLGISAATLTLAATLNPLANGGGRLFWGWVSDRIGRERTMLIAFLLQSVFLLSVLTVGKLSAIGFIVSLLLVYFTWGEVYSLFPPTAADYFGSANASSNYAFLYSTKGVASIIGGGVAAVIYQQTGSWNAVFYGSAALALCASLMTFLLRAMPLPAKRVAVPLAAAADRQVG